MVHHHLLVVFHNGFHKFGAIRSFWVAGLWLRCKAAKLVEAKHIGKIVSDP